LILQLRGKMVRKENSWFRKHYPEYGHNRAQGTSAMEEGKRIGQLLLKKD